MEDLEYRSSNITPSISSDGNTIEGYALKYYDGTPETEGDLTLVGEPGVVERIQKGAVRFADEVYAFPNHEHKAGKILAESTTGTLKLTDDGKGIKYQISLPDTSDARDLKAQIKHGLIKGSSFGMRDIKSSLQKVGDKFIKTITSLKLWEVSPCFKPVYKTGAVSLRSEIDLYQEIEKRNAMLEELQKELGVKS